MNSELLFCYVPVTFVLLQFRLYKCKRRSSQLLTQLMQLRKESLKKSGLPGLSSQLPVGLIAQLVRALHRYRRGQGSSPGKPDFFRLSFRNCISCVNNCEDLLLHLFLHSAVQIYAFHIFIISSSSFPGILRTNLMTSSQLA